MTYMETLPGASPPPHIHSGNSTRSDMISVLTALIPAFLTGVYLFRFQTVIVTGLSVLCCVGFEYAVSRFILREKVPAGYLSAVVTGVLLAFALPANFPLWLVAVGAFVAIGVGKMLFARFGKNIFNPALVGYIFLLLLFPSRVMSLPAIEFREAVDGITSATPLTEMKSHALATIFPLRMFFGIENGTIGETSAFALLLGFAYLLWRKVIPWRIPVSIFASVCVFSGALWLTNPQPQYQPLFQLLSGGLMLGAIFMATDWMTSPMTRKGMTIYGIGIGLITIAIRLWDAFPEGVSFAILTMNAFTPLIDKLVKPKRFGP